jgi:hypothetical protein
MIGMASKLRKAEISNTPAGMSRMTPRPVPKNRPSHKFAQRELRIVVMGPSVSATDECKGCTPASTRDTLFQVWDTPAQNANRGNWKKTEFFFKV